MIIVNPATEEIIADIPEDNRDSIQGIYKKALAAQQAWVTVPLTERVSCIEKFFHSLEAQKDTLARILTEEVGKPLQQSYNELNGARTRIQFFLDNSEQYLAEEWITQEELTKEKITYEPLGVIANISAWNYPYLVGVNVFIPALIGGNAVLYKSSEYATLTGLHIERMMHEAGVPKDIFQCVVGKAEAGQALLDLPLDGYFFTGSFATGKKIAESTAGKLVPVQMELGGKDPLYVMDDIPDIRLVAAAVLEGVMYNAGQSCCAVERVYVHANVYDAFCEAIQAEAGKMKIGNPMQPGMDMGPLCRPQQVAVLQKQVEDALAKGASVLYKSNELPAKGYYFPITLLIGVNHSMDIMMEESFGPVVGIQKVQDDAEAIDLMQDTVYGLTAAVYGSDSQRAGAIMQRMRTGTVYFNCCDRVSAGLPWSGRGHSGVGSTLSIQGIRAFVQPKAWHLRS
ncbi:MAG: aldehyde dehydrogenase family protein [Chitinophagaceae bacterium]|nr:aldehyde dehydrogenase family protein [Chitinophagaceae bacterium]